MMNSRFDWLSAHRNEESSPLRGLCETRNENWDCESRNVLAQHALGDGKGNVSHGIEPALRPSRSKCRWHPQEASSQACRPEFHVDARECGHFRGEPVLQRAG